MANEQKKVVLANIIWAFQHLQAHVLCPAFILAHQNLANNCPFAKFANFYSLQYFPLYGTLEPEILASTKIIGLRQLWLK